MKTTTCLLLLGLIATPVLADKRTDAIHELNLKTDEIVRAKIKTIKKGSTVEVLFRRDGHTIRGTFKNFCGYDDSFWILPEGKHGILYDIFADEAYDVREILDVNVIILRPV